MIVDPPPPPPPPPAASTRELGLPWELPGSGPGAERFVETVRRLLLAPSAAFAAARRSGSLVAPLSYAVLLGWIGILAERLWSLALGTTLLDLLPPEMRDSAGMGLAVGGFGLAVVLIVAPIVFLIGLFIWSAILHLFLMLFGATRQSPSGFEGTLRVAAWASTAQLAQIVPFAGGLVAAVWSVVLLTLGLVELHRTTPGRALSAVLAPLVLCCVCGLLFFGVVVAAIVGGAFAGSGG